MNALLQPQLPIDNYQQFYRFYLSEHRNITNRQLHVLGSSIGLASVAVALFKARPRYVLYGIAAGYACAWLGHFKYERNRPASFKQPLYSFISDWRMLADVLRGKISLKNQSLDKINCE